jgi:hypothetical protein
MNSSTSKTPRTLAMAERQGPQLSDLLSRLTALANLRDDPKAFEWFAHRWPGFIHVPESGQRYIPAEVVTGIASLPNKFLHMWQQREHLRRIWKGNTEHLAAVWMPATPPAELPSKEHNEYVLRDESEMAGEWAWPPQIKIDWHRSQFTYVSRTDFQRAVYELFRRSSLAKICGNSDCAAPYFIAAKAGQRYCSEECAEIFQREWKRRWWKEKGTDWRRKKLRGKRGKR